MSDKKVFVSLYVMLGDADSSIDGTAIISKTAWEKEKKLFAEHLEKINSTCVYGDDEHFGCYHVSLDNYKVKNCSDEEAEVIKKFFGKTTGGFKLPSEFIEEDDNEPLSQE